MFGVYIHEHDEIHLMTKEQVWKYLQENSPMFQNYSVVTDGVTVIVRESSAGANGKISEQTVEEFYGGFKHWIIIRPIQETE